MPEFKVGDRVRVIERVDKEDGWINSWTPSMDIAIGKEFFILEIKSTRGIRLGRGEGDMGAWLYPPSCLELVGVQADTDTDDADTPDAVYGSLGSINTDKAERLQKEIGPRGSIRITAKNRNKVKTWIRAMTGLPFKAVWQTSHESLRAVYNDTTNQLLVRFTGDFQGTEKSSPGFQIEIMNQQTLESLKQELSSIRKGMSKEVSRVDRLIKALSEPKQVPKDKQPERAKVTDQVEADGMSGPINLRRPSIG